MSRFVSLALKFVSIVTLWMTAGLAMASVKNSNGISVDTAMPNAQRGVYYNYDIAANNGLTGGTGGAPYTFAIVGGSLPSGFTLTPSGVVYGVNCVNANGSFKFDLAITSSGGTVGTFAGSSGFAIQMTAGPAGACVVNLGPIATTATTPSRRLVACSSAMLPGSNS